MSVKGNCSFGLLDLFSSEGVLLCVGVVGGEIGRILRIDPVGEVTCGVGAV